MAQEPFYEQVVVVTGASSGIGRELALQLAGQKAWLALAARRADLLEATAEACRQRGARALAVPTDVAVQADCRSLVERAVQTYGRLDALINNAGITMWARFDELESLEPMRAVMQTNYFGSLYCTQAALPYLKQTRGRIVQVSSLTAKAGVPTRSGYAASKHALAGFYDSLRIELEGSGVTITSVYPDFVASETRLRAFGKDGQPLGRSPVHEDQVMTAAECAHLVLQAAAGRKRDVILGLRGKVGLWLRMLAPGLVDRIARRAVERGR